MRNQGNVTISAKVPVWFRRDLGVRAAKDGKTISDYVYGLLRLALRREDWLRRELGRRSSPQMEFPPILAETRGE